MNAPLPLPNPSDWMTVPAAADLLGVDDSTARRMIAAARLTRYSPKASAREHRKPTMLWRPEVEAFAAARQTVRGPR
jgi:hypothetical protein